MIAESPAKHSTITDTELDYIQSSIGYTEEQTEVILCTQRQSKSCQIQVHVYCLTKFVAYTELQIFLTYPLYSRYQCLRYLSSAVVLVIVNN